MSISPQHKIGNLVQAIMTNPTFSEDEKSQLVEDLINEIKDTKFTMLKWQFIFWTTQFGAIVTIGFKLLGKLLGK